MDNYKSEQQIIDCNINTIYSKLSNPELLKNHIENSFDKLPDEAKANLDKVQFDTDGILIDSPMGQLKLALKDCQEPSLVRYEAQESPVAFALNINLQENGEDQTFAVADIELDLPVFVRAMVGGKIKDAAQKFGELLTKIPYEVI